MVEYNVRTILITRFIPVNIEIGCGVFTFSSLTACFRFRVTYCLPSSSNPQAKADCYEYQSALLKQGGIIIYFVGGAHRLPVNCKQNIDMI